MKILPVYIFIAILFNIGEIHVLLAQDIVITNARVIGSNGAVIEQGNIVVRSGRIESISVGTTATGLMEIDVHGMTALPGYIDAHRHIISGSVEQWFREESVIRMQEYLDAGFTTLMSGAGPMPGIVELQRRIEAGELAGPRIITSGRVKLENNTGSEAISEQVQKLAEAGVEIIKVVLLEIDDQELLKLVVTEAQKYGLEVMVHAVTVPTMIAAVEAGAAKLVHTPTRSLIEETDGARIVREAGVSMTSTLGIWVPIFSEDNVPLWRDRSPFPEEGVARAGLGPANGRHLWDAGVTYAFGTDTSFLPRDSLAHELLPLRLLFSPKDIVKLMGPNTAEFIDMSDDLGTLEPGKLADIVIIDGDPLVDISNLLNVMVVIKGGEIVADLR